MVASDGGVPMIYKGSESRICKTCGMTDLYCQAVRDMERRKCCPDGCSHS